MKPRELPRPGTVWVKRHRTRCVTQVSRKEVQYMGGNGSIYRCNHATWRTWAATAHLHAEQLALAL